MIDPTSVTLGILAGGRATRLGGIDKAWLVRDGLPQVERIASGFAGTLAAILVSANCDLPRYARHGLAVVADQHVGLGPIGGLHALATACSTSWLLTMPVDVVRADASVLQRLAGIAGETGAFAADAEGPQPLTALWNVAALRVAVETAIAGQNLSVHALQAQMQMIRACFPFIRFGNLNTAADLTAAGIAPGAP